jgi:hypothetical protein
MDPTSVRRTRRAVPLLAISAVALTFAPSAAAQSAVDACSLLTTAEVQAVLAVPIVAAERAARDYGGVCTFRGQPQSGRGQYVRVLAYRFPSADDAETQYNNQVNASEESEAAFAEKGLGDQAFSTVTTDARGRRESVIARHGRIALTVEVAAGDQIRSGDRGRALALARTVLRRLQ